MKAPRSSLHVIALLLTISLVTARPAHAYLDPGTGSYILQLLIAALLGVLFAIKMFWLRIKAFFSNLISRKPKDD
jgi:hypothetical protein